MLSRRGLGLGLVGFGLAGARAWAGPAGPKLDLAAYRGRVLYLDFWASWCAPCQLSFPYMARMQAFYGGRGLAVLAVNVDQSRAKADAFLRRVDSDLPVVFDPAGALASRFAVKAMPTSILIGRDGRTRFVHQGFVTGQTPTYEAQITELLNERP